MTANRGLEAQSLVINDTTLIIQEKKQELDALKNKLVTHPLFSSINNLEDLRTFMSWHVFAVWDFMSLTKRLQRDLTCVTLPWMPPKSAKAARLMNDIVLGEETDKIPSGKSMSHFELYINAIKEVSGDTQQIDSFLHLVQEGTHFSEAMEKVETPQAVQKFVNATIKTALEGNTSEVLGSFFFGRENVIPPMFNRILEKWKVEEQDAPMFVFYLKRHIELDSDEHGPAAMALIDELCPTPQQELDLYNAAVSAVESRIELWDGLLEHINAK
jgi:Protein of unknown function (DUF3050)